MRRKPVYNHRGFSELADKYYREILVNNPIMATWIGEHSYDSLFPETGAEAVEKNIELFKKMRSDFDSLPFNELSLDERIDCETVTHFAGKQLFIDEDLKRWKMGRDLAMNIGDSLFLLFVRDFAPLSERVKSMTARLRSVPAYLMSGKSLFQRVPALWGEMFLESARNLPAFIDTLEKSLRGHVSDSVMTEYVNASNTAKKAIGDFTIWLKNAIMPKTDTSWAMGEGAFNAYLTASRLGLNKNEVLEIGQAVIQKANEQLELLSHKILGQSTGKSDGALSEVIKRIRNKTPATFDQALKAYIEAVKNSRKFVKDSGFATMPDKEDIQILETPEFMSHVIPFSAYIGPEKASNNQVGTYLLTRKNATSRYCYAEITNNAIHEIYPGHHLQITCQNQHPGKMRYFSECLEITEGWGHYCEEATRKMGLEVSDECLFARASDALFYATRLMIDVKTQTREWSFEKALGYMIDRCNIDRNSAITELKRYSQSPGAQISNTAGKYLLTELKSNLKNQFGNDLTDRDFHDLVIYEGSLPIKVASKYFPELIKQNLKQKNGF